MRPERQFKHAGPENRHSTPLLEHATQKARLLANEPAFARIDEQAFEMYDKRKLAEDIDRVALTEERREHAMDVLPPEGEAFEMLLLDMIANRRWFGDATMRRTSKYDDYFNKVDAILGLHTQEHRSVAHLGLGLDATTSTHGMARKLTRVVENVRTGKLGYVRYADIDSFRGELRQIPEAVLYVDHVSFKRLLGNWTTGPDSAIMEHDPFQAELLMQLYYQLDAFVKIAPGQVKERLMHTRQITFQHLLERVNAIGMKEQDIARISSESASLTILRRALETSMPESANATLNPPHRA